MTPLWVAHHDGNYATILVDGDALYSMFATGKTEESLLCLNATDGSTRWQYKYPRGKPPKSVRLDFGRGPNATPLIRGDRILSVGFLGKVWCLGKANGTLVWSRDLVTDFGAKVHDFGYSISPISYKNKVIMPVGGVSHGVVALEWDTGAVAWRSEPIDVSYASPFLIEVDNQQQIVLMASTELLGLNPEDGSVLWRHPHANVNKNNCSTVWISKENEELQ